LTGPALTRSGYLLDVNVLVALVDPTHVHHRSATLWFGKGAFDWGVCALSEAGFLRVITHPKVGGYSIDKATAILTDFSQSPSYRFWPIPSGWTILAAPFSGRVYGHQQIADAYLLGLAIQEDGVLVTFDKALRHLAGPLYSKHLLVLE
jgi:toxin-antitoxin system PIN domain toxin